jgi:hypothetical protein
MGFLPMINNIERFHNQAKIDFANKTSLDRNGSLRVGQDSKTRYASEFPFTQAPGFTHGSDLSKSQTPALF